jgi:hypothetical protein
LENNLPSAAASLTATWFMTPKPPRPSAAADPGGQTPDIKTMVKIESDHAFQFI